MSGLVVAGGLIGLVLAVGLVFAVVVAVRDWVTARLGRTVLLLAVSAGLLGYAMAEGSAVAVWCGLALGGLVVGSWWFVTR